MGGFEIGLAEGVMKLAEGVTSKLWLWGKIFVGKIDKRIRAEDLRKRRNTIGGAGHCDGVTLFRIPRGSASQVCWVHVGGFTSHSQNRGWRRAS